MSKSKQKSTSKSKPAKRKPAKPVKADNGSLPPTIVNALPAARALYLQIVNAAALVPTVEKELAKAKKSGSIALARAFVGLHRLNSRLDEQLKPFYELYRRYKEIELPAAFEADKITHVPLEEGFRVGLSSRMFASIPADKREAAYQWLREHELGDLITNTVNAQTLSAAAKTLMEEKNIELPSELFTVAYVPNTSVTSTK